MEKTDAITEQVISFLEPLFTASKVNYQHVYGLSVLPYPKEKMKEVVKKCIVDKVKNDFDGSLEKTLDLCRLKGLYLNLVDFIDDDDAKFVEEVWKIYPASLADATRKKRYEKIIESIENDREKISKEINTALPNLKMSLNMLNLVC